ncbi:DUF5316 domain-containing protein [Paenibacillus polysaccharolyticus]|uniref:DUF5316 family protein n=1 Tax=Paenibacillus polysaccharolyticus TaxID=582692 RepID=UPI00203A64ED|nr:DUF5316 family protein [Paenibacillus polysaccharolyticus]MCM3132785.1 DUF5316 domain-containing protein [Paenibacillus polysaccharolyticus]
MNFFIYLGIILIFVSGLCIGAWTTGYQQRGNFHTESKEDRYIKKKVARWSTFAVAGLIYLLS